jgi:hypothetical protein
MVKRIGAHFGQELAAAGLNEGVSWSEDGTVNHHRIDPDDPDLALVSTLTPAQEAQLAALIEAHDPDAVPAIPVRVYKAPMFRRMTNAEYDAYLQIRANFPPRMQAIFDAAEYLSPEDEFWADLFSAAEQAYGKERAAELLSATA